MVSVLSKDYVGKVLYLYYVFIIRIFFDGKLKLFWMFVLLWILFVLRVGKKE